jgi:hypothetical protein
MKVFVFETTTLIGRRSCIGLSYLFLTPKSLVRPEDENARLFSALSCNPAKSFSPGNMAACLSFMMKFFGEIILPSVLDVKMVFDSVRGGTGMRNLRLSEEEK